LDFRKAEAKLVIAAASGRAPAESAAGPHIDGGLAPLLSRPLWLYSRAKQTEVLADASL
jgi:hypothetical protein